MSVQQYPVSYTCNSVYAGDSTSQCYTHEVYYKEVINDTHTNLDCL